MSNTHHVECRTTMISSPQHAQRHGTTDAEYIIHSVRGGSTKYIGLCRSVVHHHVTASPTMTVFNTTY